MEILLADFLACAGKPVGALGLGTELAHIRDNLLISFLNSLDYFPAHGVNNHSGGATINPTTERKEVPNSPASSEIVPKPARRTQSDFFFRGMVPRHNGIGRS